MTPELLYNATNNGLNIIYYFYPQAREVEGKENGKFKIRESESTPSAAMRQFDGIWKVTDFGGDGVAKSPIDICMDEKNMSFKEALYFLAAEFNVEGEGITKVVNKPDIRKRPATEDEADGSFAFEVKPEMSVSELEILGPKVKQEHCKALSYSAVKSYSMTKNGQTTTISSTDTYPIYIRECKYSDPGGKVAVFYKIYQPLNYDKGFRFFYHGNKPQKYINGLAELNIAYEKYKEDQERWDENKDKEGNPKDNIKFQKIPQAFICSGERDALCVKALGYHPLWFNSETYNLTHSEFKSIMNCVERLYNIPDLDSTGIDRGMKLAMRFITIHTIWLPSELSKYRDRRGNPRKDFRDYCDIWSTQADFKNLLNIGMPIQFWEQIEGKSGKRLEINTDYLEYFLKCNGFVSIADKNSKSGITFVKIDDNVVREVEFHEIKTFLKQYVRNRFEPVEIRNLINNSSRITESSLGLKTVELDFENHTKTSQMFFFRNATWEVSADGVKEYKRAHSEKHVWSENLIEHDVTRLDRSFDIEEIGHQEDLDPIFNITVNNNHNSNYFRYLLNASRIYWRKEFEPDGEIEQSEETEEYIKKYKFAIDGDRLHPEEINEQKQHLLNKIFCIGYLLHRYKAKHRAWCVFAMDNKIGANNESNGGSGKSFGFSTLSLFMKTVTLSGRNSKLTENSHIYERVTEHTGLILVDDAQQYLNFDYFFDGVTGGIQVNPKNTKSYEIAFAKAAKFIITSNFVLRRTDPSTARRILYTVFSDYYHQKTEKNDYLETRTIFDDFGKELLRDEYTAEEWNADLNFFVDCEQTYLRLVQNSIKIQPPLENVVLRGLLADMGDQFFDWAMVYFSPDAGNCDVLVPREKAFKAFQATTGQSRWQINKFTSALKSFCEYAEHVVALDPDEYKNKQGRIIRKSSDNVEKRYMAMEMIYVQTKEHLNLSEISTSNSDDNEDTDTRKDTGSDKLPF